MADTSARLVLYQPCGRFSQSDCESDFSTPKPPQVLGHELYHRPMSHASPTEPSSAADVTEFPAERFSEAGPAAPFVADSAPASRVSGLSRWTPLAALVIAVIALTLAVVGWWYPHKSASSSSAPTYSEQQIKDAKTHICNAFMLVDRAVVRNTHLKNPPQAGPLGAFSVATSARLALYGGGAYLRDQVNINPAAPADLAKSTNAVSTTLQELGIGYLANAPEFTQSSLRQNLDAQIKATAGQCK
jgi:hypothetical protein